MVKNDEERSNLRNRAFAEGTKSLFVTCPMCGRNRPLKDKWGKGAHFVVKPDYALIQARYSIGRGSGFFLKEDESLSIDQVKDEFPEIYEEIKAAVEQLHDLFK